MCLQPLHPPGQMACGLLAIRPSALPSPPLPSSASCIPASISTSPSHSGSCSGFPLGSHRPEKDQKSSSRPPSWEAGASFPGSFGKGAVLVPGVMLSLWNTSRPPPWHIHHSHWFLACFPPATSLELPCVDPFWSVENANAGLLRSGLPVTVCSQIPLQPYSRDLLCG